MKRALFAGLSGLLFAIGLGISGMTRPDKVLGFLDLGGDWDPSLALVMAGAIAAHLLPVRWIAARGRPFLDDRVHLPPFTRIDAKLLGGSALFGVGWGLAGYCPGPALASAGVGHADALLFVAAMGAGMAVHALAERITTPKITVEPAPSACG